MIGDDRGSLIALEANRLIPFDIQRVYYIYSTKINVERGFHAHRELQQIAIAVNGACTMLLDDGSEKKEIKLNSCAQALYIGPGIWRVMREFTADCVLLVMASHYYDEKDYIRDYNEFLNWVKDKKNEEVDFDRGW